MSRHPFAAASIVVIAALSISLPASAQFGRAEVARPDKDEVYADKAVQNGWYDDAIERYTAACTDKSRQKATWSRNCRKLADIYRRGLEGGQDYEKAGALYDEACFAGRDAESCMQQAHISFKGNDGEQNYRYARKLYKEACTLGNQTGCAGYGSMLYRGQGGAMKRDEGKQYIQDACAKGDSWACDRATGFGLPDRQGL